MLSQGKEKLKIIFDPGTSEPMKGRILKAIEQQNQLGIILMLRAQCNSWATAAIHRAQFWKVIIGAWKDRNEVLHHGKNNTISQSEHDEKIKWH